MSLLNIVVWDQHMNPSLCDTVIILKDIMNHMFPMDDLGKVSDEPDHVYVVLE